MAGRQSPPGGPHTRRTGVMRASKASDASSGMWRSSRHVGVLPAPALQQFLGYNDARGQSFDKRTLFTDLWMTVAAASTEVDRLLALGRRHAEVAVSGLHNAGLRDEQAVMLWMRKYGRNEGERARLQDMLDRMGVGVGK